MQLIIKKNDPGLMRYQFIDVTTAYHEEKRKIPRLLL